MEKDTRMVNQMFERLANSLPSFMVYHSLAHTQYVIDRAVFLAKLQGCSAKEVELVSIAALYHDSGFLIGSENHEMIGCFLVKEELPAYGFSSDDIQAICGMIMATKIPQQPKNDLEKILADADLFYLGTDLYLKQSELLKMELRHNNPMLSDEDWKETQVNFLTNHEYHTDYGKETLTPVKEKNLALVIRTSVG
ncbi:MAG: HD domain-containing protein [Mongoliitalea sp.]